MSRRPTSPTATCFRAHYEILGAQRNTKILGIFTRLWKRDGKPHYLPLQPRVWAYLERNLAHPALGAGRAPGSTPTFRPSKRAAAWAKAAGGMSRQRKPLALRPEPEAATCRRPRW